MPGIASLLRYELPFKAIFFFCEWLAGGNHKIENSINRRKTLLIGILLGLSLKQKLGNPLKVGTRETWSKSHFDPDLGEKRGLHHLPAGRLLANVRRGGSATRSKPIRSQMASGASGRR